MKIIGERILVKPDEVKSETESGLVIPEKKKPMPKRGKVVQSNIEEISKNDIVRFKPYAWFEVEIEGKLHFIIDKKNVTGIERD